MTVNSYIKGEDISVRVYNHWISSTGAKYPWLLLNRYIYVCNNPINLVDHWGLLQSATGYNPGPANAVAGVAEEINKSLFSRLRISQYAEAAQRMQRYKQEIENYYLENGKPIPSDLDSEFRESSFQNKYLNTSGRIRRHGSLGPLYDFHINWSGIWGYEQ